MSDLIEIKDREILFSTLDMQDEVIDFISFIDATMLNDDILIYLFKKGFLNSSLTKINIYNGYLYSYLLRLGIKNVYYLKNRNLIINRNIENYVLRKIQVREFLEKVNDTYGYNYKEYRIESLKRRIKIGMLKAGIDDFNTYTQQVLNNKDIFDDLFLEFSITVTEYFRDPKTFLAIRNKVLPYLDSFPHLKIWCAGCSSGDEAYSLAILLQECDMLKKTTIYATDINGYVIKEGKNGLFSKDRIEIAEANYVASGGNCEFKNYFTQFDAFYRINRNFSEKILFFSHSLLESGILNEFNLILCRNVLIYFEPSLQDRSIKLFKDSLDMSGLLILGKSESLFLNDKNVQFKAYDLENKIYKNFF